jgi:hypothetical protein
VTNTSCVTAVGRFGWDRGRPVLQLALLNSSPQAVNELALSLAAHPLLAMAEGWRLSLGRLKGEGRCSVCIALTLHGGTAAGGRGAGNGISDHDDHAGRAETTRMAAEEPDSEFDSFFEERKSAPLAPRRRGGPLPVSYVAYGAHARTPSVAAVLMELWYTRPIAQSQTGRVRQLPQQWRWPFTFTGVR